MFDLSSLKNCRHPLLLHKISTILFQGIYSNSLSVENENGCFSSKVLLNVSIGFQKAIKVPIG